MIHGQLYSQLEKVPGGYIYMGSASFQVCFPLVAGGELRFSWDEAGNLEIDHYDGLISPCISGPSIQTGELNG